MGGNSSLLDLEKALESLETIGDIEVFTQMILATRLSLRKTILSKRAPVYIQGSPSKLKLSWCDTSDFPIGPTALTYGLNLPIDDFC